MWTSVTSPADCGFVAGLIAGDGHFLIRPNNGGAAWQCALAVRLRADDTPLLARMCRWSGVGKLSPVPAYRTSRPQTCWTVQRQAECLRLASILDRYLVLGKKRGEYAIWRSAVDAWVGSGRDRHAVVADCADRLRAYRSHDNVPVPSQVSITEPQLLAFLAGFVTAEGHLGATAQGHPHFTINLRSDDGEILRLFHEWLGLGRLVDVPPHATSKQALSWRIGRLAELRTLTALLDRFPPRGRVLRIYEVWRELVLLVDRRGQRRRELAVVVRQRRAYKPGLETIVPVDALAARRRRHVVVLRAWAAAAEGPWTSGLYEAWRRDSAPDAPGRNTIVAAFGSWVAALDAAGLSREGCRTPEEIRRAQAKAHEAKDARVAAVRAAVVAAVRDCERALGRPPRAIDFLRWRAECAAGVPSQMTIYRAFPGGWASVLDAAASPG